MIVIPSYRKHTLEEIVLYVRVCHVNLCIYYRIELIALYYRPSSKRKQYVYVKTGLCFSQHPKTSNFICIRWAEKHSPLVVLLYRNARPSHPPVLSEQKPTTKNKTGRGQKSTTAPPKAEPKNILKWSTPQSETKGRLKWPTPQTPKFGQTLDLNGLLGGVPHSAPKLLWLERWHQQTPAKNCRHRNSDHHDHQPVYC